MATLTHTEVPGPGMNPSHSCNLAYSCGNAFLYHDFLIPVFQPWLETVHLLRETIMRKKAKSSGNFSRNAKVLSPFGLNAWVELYAIFFSDLLCVIMLGMKTYLMML